MNIKISIDNQIAKRDRCPVKAAIRQLFPILIALFFATGCGTSVADIEEQVKKSISESPDIGLGVTVDEVSLVKKGGNEYTGFVKLRRGGETKTRNLKVTVDGDRFIWVISGE